LQEIFSKFFLFQNMSKRQPTEKQLEALAKGRETRQANREKLKAMTPEQRAEHNQKLREARRNAKVDRLKNPRSQRDKINVLYDYVVSQKLSKTDTDKGDSK
jgi:formylglycine-generating enzyme required for sulfatase activity